MKSRRFLLRALGAALGSIALAASAQTFTVAQEIWDRPRSGPSVMARPEIRQAVDAWLARPGARLVVHHGPGQELLVQAEELRAWLIALAIEADRVTLRNDLGPQAAPRIEVAQQD